MDESTLVRLLGFPATLTHGDPLVVDRWLWLRRRLPKTANGESLIDVGCGSGAFTIGAALRGYHAHGLSWDERNQRVAQQRAEMCKAASATFGVIDVRHLDTRPDLVGKFDVAICFETIEHVIDDRKLIGEIALCLKPGGRLFLTTPYYYYQAISPADKGPFSQTEDGWHVRRGYTPAMLTELCECAGLVPEKVSYCSGFFSQKLAWMHRMLSRSHRLIGWTVVFPLRIIPVLFDRAFTALVRWPHFSICVEAYKPRFGIESTSRRGVAAETDRKAV